MNIDRTIAAVIVIILIIGIIGIFNIISNPTPSEKFTEFYILDGDGKAINYPTNLSVGETANLTVCVVNHEYKTTSYLIKITQDSQVLKEENITLNNDDKKEIPFEFTAGSAGEEKLEFKLYKLPDTENVYRYLYLQIYVT
ncbi:MAG: hypothetical protein A4E25_02385 [Methanobacterium sp. PtaB.Bin024]|jgi:uncharacterized membrane protein|nr:MAG: hypothetical protein A4E25_02385 [Methanobacterium sp. PtaB.Bin024]